MSALKARPARSTAQRDGSRTSAFEATTKVICRSSTAAVRPNSETAAVEQQRDARQLVVLGGDAEADLLDVERAEAALDRQPPRPAAVAGAQPDQDRPAAVLLHRERRAERGRELARPFARIAEDALGDAIAAARAGDAGGELGELQLHAARLRARVDAREHVQRDRADRERAGVEKRAVRCARRAGRRRSPTFPARTRTCPRRDRREVRRSRRPRAPACRRADGSSARRSRARA